MNLAKHKRVIEFPTRHTISLSGEYKVILDLPYCDGGRGAVTSGLVEGSDGLLYGFDRGGYDGPAPFLFRMNLDGSGLADLATVDLYVGSGPYTFGPAFIQGSDGNFYGTNENGGSSDAYEGTVFELALGLPAPLPRVVVFEPKFGTPGTPVRIKSLLRAAQLITP